MFFNKKKKSFVYLDHAATTYIDERVKQAMEPFWIKEFTNPSSLYAPALKVKGFLSEARKKVAKILQALPDNIIFTSTILYEKK